MPPQREEYKRELIYVASNRQNKNDIRHGWRARHHFDMDNSPGNCTHGPWYRQKMTSQFKFLTTSELNKQRSKIEILTSFMDGTKGHECNRQDQCPCQSDALLSNHVVYRFSAKQKNILRGEHKRELIYVASNKLDKNAGQIL